MLSVSALAAALFRVFVTCPGAPMTIEFGGMTVRSFRKAPPATMLFSPITQPSMIVAPMPIRQLSPIVQPCSVTRWVIEQFAPTIVSARSPTWIITKSWMLVLGPMSIR